MISNDHNEGGGLSLNKVLRIFVIPSLFLVGFLFGQSTPNSSAPNDPLTKTLRKSEQGLAQLGQISLFDASVTDPWKQELFQRLDRIRTKCGKLCTINDEPTLNAYSTNGEFFRHLEVPVDCKAIMNDEDVDVGDKSVPYPIPEELMPYYGMSGMVQVLHNHKLAELYLDGDQYRAPVWTKEYIDLFVEKAGGDEEIYPPYGNYTNKLRDTLRDNIDMKGKKVLVIGTQIPWVEGICLHLGASHVTTLEYGSIQNEDPRITTLTPAEFRKAYKSGKVRNFDVVVSFSSLEHAGLGRYGDSLNPWGDILSTARARCVTKKGGYMVLAVPTGQDTLHFNAHRLYGKARYPLLAANWDQVVGDIEELENHKHTHKQPAFVFRNP